MAAPSAVVTGSWPWPSTPLKGKKTQTSCLACFLSVNKQYLSLAWSFDDDKFNDQVGPVAITQMRGRRTRVWTAAFKLRQHVESKQ